MVEGAQARATFARIPRHVGFIPDGNRRWADARGLPRGAGYAAGVEPGLQMLDVCRGLGIEEVSVYGFTKENVRRPSDQVELFRRACVEFTRRLAQMGAALLVVGDTDSTVFPRELQRFAARRSSGDIRVNLLVNYGWQWDLRVALRRAAFTGASSAAELLSLGSADVTRIDLVVRWGGRRRLSGFLPVQCAYADFHVIDTLWPDATQQEFVDALAWYQTQDVTLGG